MSAQIKLQAVEHLIRTKKGHNDLLADKAGFEKLAGLVKDLTGISLPTNDKNMTLLAGRMCSLIDEYSLSGYEDLHRTLLTSARPGLKEDFISCITTNTTHFFRESAHYDFLKSTLPKLLSENGKSSLRVWCSACSTGQEAYSILFTLLKSGFQTSKQKLEFLATDIDLDVLQKASRGLYNGEEVKSLPQDVKDSFFGAPQDQKLSNHLRVRNEFSQLINFARFNLIDDRPAFREKFDVIFCRNVLIYFEKDVATAVINMLISQLKPHGLLFLGHVETGLLKNKTVRPLHHAVYQKVGQ